MSAPRPMKEPLSKVDTPSRGEFCLLVIGDRQFASHWLPDAGELVIGRDQGCDVQIEDASIAPRQVLLKVGGGELSLVDLSGNGSTRVRGERVGGPDAVKFVPSELVNVGSVMLLVQKRANAPSRRIWTHGYFETRLEEECLRAERFKTQFAILRVRCRPSVDNLSAEEALSRALRLVDVVGAYGPGSYQILLSDTSPDDARRVADRLRAKLGELGQVDVGLACHPRDGRSADELSAKVGEDLMGAAATQLQESSAAEETAGAMLSMHQLVERVAASTINVLILGETGAGKEKLAQQVHKLSPRANKPFLGLNGAALSESLLESELFGHERGAFTGAVQAKPGLLESAEGGTLFLDEVGELPMSIQAKLLRVLETRQVLRVGSVKPKSIDVRIVAATNADLEGDVARGRFRQDLFFRLNGVSLMIPPLRERLEEIVPLAEAFVVEACRKYSRQMVPRISDEAFALMRRYRWPGNIRELRNVVERAVVICDGSVIDLRHLPVEKLSATFASRSAAPPLAPPRPVTLSGAVPPTPAVDGPGRSEGERATDGRPTSPPVPSGPKTREELLSELKAVERQRIVDALAACVGNQTRAAEVLGISRRTLVNRMIALGIPGPRSRRAPSGQPG